MAGAEIDDDDVLMAITIQDVLVLLSSGEDFPVSTSNTYTEKGRCIYIFMCMHVYGGNKFVNKKQLFALIQSSRHYKSCNLFSI